MHGDGAEDCGDDGGGVLEYGEYFCPVYFHFTQNYFEDNTLLIKSPEIKEMAEIL